MKIKKIPQRMCVACREMHDKRELIRIVRSPDGILSVDTTGKKNGRGAYVCRKSQCIEKCLKNGIIKKALDTEISEELKAELKAFKEE